MAAALKNGDISARKRHIPPTNKKPEKRRSQDPEQEHSPLCRVLEKIAKALGLKENFLEQVKSVPDDVLLHRGIKGLVLIYIEDAYYDIEEQSLKTELSEELLKQVGFTDSKVRGTMMRRSKMMAQHLEPIDFIKRFVEDEFKYNPTLIKELGGQEDDDSIPLPTAYAPENAYCGDYRLFHGTDLKSAVDIMKNGIELDFGRHKHDFSDGGGFYLTASFKHAETWARSQTRKPVVLELKIPKTCLENACTLALDVSNREKRSDWDRVVKENRSGRPSKEQRQKLKQYDCITGQISVPSQDHTDKREPEFGSHQLCVVTRRFADEIENHAKYTRHIIEQE